MAIIINVTKKILSLRGEILFTDQNDRILFVANSESLIVQKWTLKQQDKIIATLSKQFFSLKKSWAIESDLGNFHIQSKFWSWSQSYSITEDPFNGATIKSNLLGRQCEIHIRDTLVARATDQLLSLQNNYKVEIFEDETEYLLLAAIGIIVLMQDKKSNSD